MSILYKQMGLVRTLLMVAGCFFVSACAPTADPGMATLPRDVDLGDVTLIHGVYGPTCKSRLGAWSLGTDERCGPPLNPPLSVELGNEDCMLTITAVQIDCVFYTTRGIKLQGVYQEQAFPFVKEGECDPSFYANSSLTDKSYSKKFLIKFVYSKKPTSVSASAIAKFDTVTAYVLDTQIPAPDYLLDTKDLNLQVNIAKKVIVASGVLRLQPGVHPGEQYAVLPSQLMDGQRNYHDVHALFQTTPHFSVDTPIPAALLQMMNVTLTVRPEVQRSIIVAHTERNITSYELITLTITPP